MKRLLIALAIVTMWIAVAPSAGASVISFTGTVTDQTTTLPLSGITVDLYRPNGSLLASTTTDVNGQWQFTDRATMKYTFKFSDPSTAYSTEWWNNKPDLPHATIIGYVAGSTVTCDASLI